MSDVQAEGLWRIQWLDPELRPVVARLIAEAEERGAARVRERVKRALVRNSHAIHSYSLDAIRAALTDEAQP